MGSQDPWAANGKVKGAKEKMTWGQEAWASLLELVNGQDPYFSTGLESHWSILSNREFRSNEVRLETGGFYPARQTRDASSDPAGFTSPMLETSEMLQ